MKFLESCEEYETLMSINFRMGVFMIIRATGNMLSHFLNPSWYIL